MDHRSRDISNEDNLQPEVRTKQLLSNKLSYTEDDTKFWECLRQPSYADINIIFDDGQLPTNRAFLAAISSLVITSITETTDVIILQGVKMQNFHDLLFLFTDRNRTDNLVYLPDSIAEVVKSLDVKIFQPKDGFKANLEIEKNYLKTRRDLEPIKQITHFDKFAPGYAAKETQLIKAEHSTEDKITQNNEEPKTEDNIEILPDMNGSESANHHGSNDVIPINITENSNITELTLGSDYFFEELIVKEDLRSQSEEATLDEVVAPFLKCHDCHQSGYSTLTDLIQHMREIHKWTHQLHYCIFCGIPFMEKIKCIKHELESCRNVSSTCYKCGEDFGKKGRLLEHLVKDHRHGTKRKCPHCDEEFMIIMHLGINKWPHIEQFLTDSNEERKSNAAGRPKGSTSRSCGKRICDDCGGTFKDSWKHKRQCTALNKDIKFICNSCKKGFRRLGAVKKHFKLFNKCKMEKQNQTEYSKLMKYVDNNIKGRTVCQDCGCEYVTRKGPLEHRKNCSSYTQFKCNSCNRGINAMDGFHIHFSKFPQCRKAPENTEIVEEIVARSQKPEFHVCYLCGAQYKAKESIEKHMLTHSESVEYLICKQQDCGKKFLTQKALDMHLKNHTMPKVICSICGKQVKQGSMPLHMILHTGKKIECHLCGKLFQHKGVLNKHIRTIHSEKKPMKIQKEKKKKTKKENGLLLRTENKVTLLQPPPPIQTIQVSLDSDGQQPQTLRLNMPGTESVDPVTSILPQVAANVPINVLTSANLQHFLQIGAQQRYQQS